MQLLCILKVFSMDVKSMHIANVVVVVVFNSIVSLFYLLGVQPWRRKRRSIKILE